jgi:hypothetical protein
MLEEMLAVMRRHHRRRRIRRQLGTAVALVLIAAGGAWIVRAQGPTPTSETTDQAGGPQPRAPFVVVIEPNHRTGVVKVIDDDELVQRLAEIDRPTGLIRSEGQIWLTGAVVDAKLETDDPPESPL